MNRHAYGLIPDHMMEAIDQYVKIGRPLGGFLTAVFSNDLFRAVGRADEDNLEIIPIYVSYIYNKTPHSCHGSPEHVEEWIRLKQSERNSP